MKDVQPEWPGFEKAEVAHRALGTKILRILKSCKSQFRQLPRSTGQCRQSNR